MIQLVMERENLFHFNMREKTCFKCNIKKPITEFYIHKQMSDGYLNKCKECNKKDVTNNYKLKRKQYHDYEKTRNQKIQRKKNKVIYTKKSREKNPEKYKARLAISNGIKNGTLVQEPCIYCGNIKSEAHHHDYSKPLDIIWVCFKCHREIEHGQTVI